MLCVCVSKGSSRRAAIVPLSFPLPVITSADDAAKLMASILSAVATGDVTPSEASDVARLVETFTKVLETAEFERRLEVLEGKS